MTMHRRDYELIAKVFKRARSLSEAVELLTPELARDNPAFNPDKFLTACRKEEVSNSCGCVFADLNTRPPNGRCINLAEPDAIRALTEYCKGDVLMTSELKPCPFCGGENVHLNENYESFGIRMTSIWCGTCDASFTNTMATKEATISLWNSHQV